MPHQSPLSDQLAAVEKLVMDLDRTVLLFATSPNLLPNRFEAGWAKLRSYTLHGPKVLLDLPEALKKAYTEIEVAASLFPSRNNMSNHDEAIMLIQKIVDLFTAALTCEATLRLGEKVESIDLS